MNIFFQLFGLLAVTIAQSRGRRALYPDDRDNSSHIIPDRDLTHSLPAEISMAVNEVGDSFLLPSSEGVDLEFEKYSNGKRSIDVTLGELQKEQTKPDEIDKSYLTRLNEQFFNLRVIGNYVATVCGALSSLVNLEARDVLANKLMADYILLREAALNSATEDALAYHQDDRYEKAVDIFTLVINEKKESVNPVDYYWRGLSYFHLQKHSESIADFTVAIDLRKEQGKPAACEDYFWRSIAHGKTGNYQKAIFDIIEALSLHEKLGERAEANDIQWKYINDNLTSLLLDYTVGSEKALNASFQLALAFYHAGECKKAVGLLNLIIGKKESVGPTHYYWRGLSYHQLAEYSKAMADFTAAIDLRRERGELSNPDDYKWRGLARDKLKLSSQARADFTTAIDLRKTQRKPIDSDDYGWRGLNYAENGHYSDAIDDLTMAIDLRKAQGQPAILNEYDWRGKSHYFLGHYLEAISDLAEGISLREKLEMSVNLIDYYRRGMSYFYLNEYRKAIEDYRKLLSLKIFIDQTTDTAIGNIACAIGIIGGSIGLAAKCLGDRWGREARLMREDRERQEMEARWRRLGREQERRLQEELVREDRARQEMWIRRRRLGREQERRLQEELEREIDLTFRWLQGNSEERVLNLEPGQLIGPEDYFHVVTPLIFFLTVLLRTSMPYANGLIEMTLTWNFFDQGIAEKYISFKQKGMQLTDQERRTLIEELITLRQTADRFINWPRLSRLTLPEIRKICNMALIDHMRRNARNALVEETNAAANIQPVVHAATTVAFFNRPVDERPQRRQSTPMEFGGQIAPVLEQRGRTFSMN